MDNLPIHIISSTIAIPYTGILTFHTLLDHAFREHGNRVLFSVSKDSLDTTPKTFLIWITNIRETALLDIQDVAIQCTHFCNTQDGNSPSELVAACHRLEPVSAKEEVSPIATSFLIVLSRLPLVDRLSLQSNMEQEKRPSTFGSWSPQTFNSSSDLHPNAWIPRFAFDARSRKSPKSMLILRGCAFLLFCFLVFSIINPHSNAGAGEYIRYPTGDSEGPKHQLRIYIENATEWARNNPHDNGEWRVRVDDQAIIPAHLYDDEEDKYQQWFAARYPHYTEIVEKKNYIRPSWLGSWNVGVPWDKQFHDAHCALVIRRYFNAKESGKHVCGRDIDYGHVKHCIDSMDAKAFPPGPMVKEDPPMWMYWKTKVCF